MSPISRFVFPAALAVMAAFCAPWIVPAGSNVARAAPDAAEPRSVRPYLPPYMLFPDAAETEHWPSNYVPNTYDLPAYQKGYEPPTNCRGRTGLTLSTESGRCSPGQQPAPNKNRLSTAPDAP